METKVINFMGQRKLAAGVSVVLLLISIASLAVNGLKFGLDFTGGTLIEVGYENKANVGQIRSVLVDAGMENPVVAEFGAETDVIIKTQGSQEDIALTKIRQDVAKQFGERLTVLSAERPEKVEGNFVAQVNFAGDKALSDQVVGYFEGLPFGAVKHLESDQGFSILTENGLPVAYLEQLIDILSESSGDNVELRRSEFVGPQIGEELRDDGGLGMLFALVVVMIYVAMRFQFKFSVGAVAALIHDVIIVLGVFSLLQLDFDLTVLAAVLAVIGYSLNDTIVVSDRIRENFRKLRKGDSLEVINVSLTETLGRTLVTSLTTILVLLALFFVGGELIHNFSTALLIGVGVGTYSSIYVAANVLLAMHITKEDLMPPEKEGEEFEDGMP